MEFCKSQHRLDWGAKPVMTCARLANHDNDHEAYPFKDDDEFIVYWNDNEAL
jgi:hypothetical protein